MIQVGMTILLSGWAIVGGAHAEDGANAANDSEIVLFNGRDFVGWISDPKTLAHWSIRDDELQSDGMGGNLVSERNYRDFEIELEWRAEAGSTGGIWIRGRPKILIADPASEDARSGSLVHNEKAGQQASARADRPAGEWNVFKIRAVGPLVTVELNGQLLIDKIEMENSFDRSRRLPVSGKIEIETKGPMAFRKIVLRPIVHSGS